MPPPQPLYIIQLSGPPGSGKSTIARSLAPHLNAVVINHDLLKSFFLTLSHPFDESAKLAYRLDWVLAADLLAQGRSVIVDSVCNYSELFEKGQQVAAGCGAGYRFVQCKVGDVEVLEKRLRGRVAMRSQRSAIEKPPVDAGEGGEDHREVLRRKMENPVQPASGVIVVDSGGSTEECVEEILRQIVG